MIDINGVVRPERSENQSHFERAANEGADERRNRGSTNDEQWNKWCPRLACRGVSGTERGALGNPILDVAMRAHPGHSVKGRGASPG